MIKAAYLQSFLPYLANVVAAWKTELKERAFRLKLMLTPGLFFIYAAATQPIGNYVEHRKGMQPADALLDLFPRADLSPHVFLLLYSSLFLLILTHADKPKTILRIVTMHFWVAVVRQLCILGIALEPPTGLIVLRDMFLENTIYPHNSPLTKDLFFSGHVASLWIYFLCASRKYIRMYLGFGTLLMSFMVLTMRIHYTYDVYGALFFTTIIYWLPAWVQPRLFPAASRSFK